MHRLKKILATTALISLTILIKLCASGYSEKPIHKGLNPGIYNQSGKKINRLEKGNNWIVEKDTIYKIVIE